MAQSQMVSGQSSQSEAKTFVWRGANDLFPSPYTLPRGEGTASFAHWKADNDGLFCGQRTVHPLPKGEGRREGNGAKHVTRIGPIPELSNSSSPPAESEVFHKDYETV